jgi:hypothetical protein
MAKSAPSKKPPAKPAAPAAKEAKPGKDTAKASKVEGAKVEARRSAPRSTWPKAKGPKKDAKPMRPAKAKRQPKRQPSNFDDEDELDREPREEMELDDDDDAPRRASSKEAADAAAMEAETKRPAGKKAAAVNQNQSKLIELGKAKGFLTYDEINDHMPDDVVSTEQIDSWLSSLGDHGIAIVDGATPRPAADDKGGLDLSKDKDEEEATEGAERHRGRGVRLQPDLRSGAHVPAQDGLGVAAHPRGRGRDRQAHRGGRAPHAAGGAQLVGRRRGAARDRRAPAQGQGPRQGRGQGHRRGGGRVRREVAHRAGLQGHRQDPQDPARQREADRAAQRARPRPSPRRRRSRTSCARTAS